MTCSGRHIQRYAFRLLYHSDVIEVNVNILCVKLFLVSTVTLMHLDVVNKLPQDFRCQLRHLQMPVNNGEEVPHVVQFVLLPGKLICPFKASCSARYRPFHCWNCPSVSMPVASFSKVAAIRLSSSACRVFACSSSFRFAASSFFNCPDFFAVSSYRRASALYGF